MNIFKAIGYRAYECIAAGIMYIWGWFFPNPIVIKKQGAVKELPAVIKQQKINKVLIVTDKNLMKLQLLDGLLTALTENEVEYTIYDNVQPNPTVNNVEQALELYNSESCEGIVAVGGGSPMDCAKAVMARVARPNRPVKKMGGMAKVIMPAFKMNGILPPKLFAVPTTAGTGSETTIVSVITNEETHDKFAIVDPFIRAKYTILDPDLTVGLPPKITSTTGLDALTHAVEGYINVLYNNKKFDTYGVDAVKLIFKYLERACKDGHDIEARENMLIASYYAGLCFTRGGVGYVHGIGHRLGGLYGVPHGLAMAVILPHVISDELYGPKIYKKLAKLADAVGIEGEDDCEKAHKFVDEIIAMNERLNIPSKFDCIKEEDVPVIAERCLKEVIPEYPVPVFKTQEQIEEFIRTYLM